MKMPSAQFIPTGLVKPTEKHVGVGKAAGASAIKVDNQPYLIEIQAPEMRRIVQLKGGKHWWETTDSSPCVKLNFRWTLLKPSYILQHQKDVPVLLFCPNGHTTAHYISVSPNEKGLIFFKAVQF